MTEKTAGVLLLLLGLLLVASGSFLAWCEYVQGFRIDVLYWVDVPAGIGGCIAGVMFLRRPRASARRTKK